MRPPKPMMTFQMAPHKEHVIWMWRHRVLIQDVFRRFTHNFPIGKTTNLTESILIPYTADCGTMPSSWIRAMMYMSSEASSRIIHITEDLPQDMHESECRRIL